MAVCYILDFAGADAGAYDRVIERMELHGRMAPGGLFHAAGASGGGWRVVDVWDSDEAFQSFATEKIGPITQDEGLSEPTITRVEVHRMFDERDSGEDIRFFQVVHLPGVDAETFDEGDQRVRQSDGLPDGCVFHVNGPTDGGWLVADGWTDKAVRDEFLANRIIPVMSELVQGEPKLDDMDVHNTMVSA